MWYFVARPGGFRRRPWVTFYPQLSCTLSSELLSISDKLSLMEVSTRQLRAFRLAAQHHSFARAAEALYITPSGLSVLIKELESRVGFRLFDRTTRHVELTAQGGELLVVIQRSLEELDAA